MAVGVKIGARSAKAVTRRRRHVRVRKKISGTTARPRLVVTRSLRHVTAQVVDDVAGHTMVSASSLDASLRGGSDDKTTQARKVGELVAARATKAGITTVVFDRGGNRYHGRVAALAEGAREGGLAF